jgi:PAS domain S-box-containing protein
MGNAVSRNYKTKKSIKKLFNNYFEYISTSVLLVNRDGVIIECNNNLVKLLGYEKTLLIGDNISKLIPQHFQNHHQSYLKNFNIDKKRSRLMGKSRSVSIMTFTGKLIPIEITLDIIKIQSIEYILVFISEVVNELNKIENLEYKMFFDVSVEMFCIANTDGYFVKTNEAFTKVLGYTEMELKQVPFLEFVHPNDKQATLETFQYLKDEKYISDFINRYKTKTGEYKSLRWKAYSYNGIVYATAYDITKELSIYAQLYEKNLLFEEAEKLAKLSSWKLNVKTKDLFWTNGIKSIYNIGVTEKVTFSSFLDLCLEEDKELLLNTIENCISTKEPFDLIIRVKTSSAIQYVYSFGKYITIGEDNYIIGIGQDITKTFNSERELNEAKQVAEKSSELSSIFLANMSHEIRTPINGVVGMTSLLQSTTLTLEQEEYVKVISDSCGILLSLINNILDFARIESQKEKVNFETLNLEEFITYINNTIKPIAIKKNIEFNIIVEANVPLHIYTDSVKLNQIISNLLNNAIKFTHQGSVSLLIKVKFIDNSEMIIFEVKDTGIGISEEDQKKLFIPFSQVDSSTTKIYGGTGLGLSICKKLTDLLGGTIKMFSILNKGTTVIFSLPIKRLNELLLKNTSLKQVLIVIVEDNRPNQFLLEKILKKLGYKSVLLFSNGMLAVQGLQNVKPDIILMDIHMPIMNGYDCTKELRKMGVSCPIIALSANVMLGVKDHCISAGMDDFISKPFVLSDISSILKKWLYLKEK